jgi:hypothetical protein
MDPAELLLEHVWSFWTYIGYRLCDDLTDEEIEKPSYDMRQFLREPFLVRLAFKVWLREGAVLEPAAAFLPMLALWFRDPELPGFDGAEEAAFLDQWLAYVRWCLWKRRG